MENKWAGRGLDVKRSGKSAVEKGKDGKEEEEIGIIRNGKEGRNGRRRIGREKDWKEKEG
jgi:hypothetical protein